MTSSHESWRQVRSQLWLYFLHSCLIFAAILGIVTAILVYDLVDEIDQWSEQVRRDAREFMIYDSDASHMMRYGDSMPGVGRVLGRLVFTHGNINPDPICIPKLVEDRKYNVTVGYSSY